MNKRGELNLNILSGVLLSVGFLVIAATLVLLLVSTISNASVFGATPTVLHTVTNESDDTGNIVYLNGTNYTLSRVNGTNSAYTITAVWVNLTATGNTPRLALSGNYSVTSAGVLYNTTAAQNVTQWSNASVSYTYIETYAASGGQLATGNLSSNITSGVNTIGSKLPTVFTVLAIIFVLLLISVLYVIYRQLKIGSSFG